MDALGGVPKLREIHGQRVPGLAALAAIKNEKSKERAGDDFGRDDRTFAEGTVLHRCARLREVSRSEPWLLEQQPVREPAWAFVSHRYSRGRRLSPPLAVGVQFDETVPAMGLAGRVAQRQYPGESDCVLIIIVY